MGVGAAGLVRDTDLEGVVPDAAAPDDAAVPLTLFLLPDAPCIALDCGLLVALLAEGVAFGDFPAFAVEDFLPGVAVTVRLLT